jgi:hypothetical protein
VQQQDLPLAVFGRSRVHILWAHGSWKVSQKKANGHAYVQQQDLPFFQQEQDVVTRFTAASNAHFLSVLN